MNKEFMNQIFEALYTDPIYDIVASTNKDYKDLNRIRSKLHAMLGSNEPVLR